MQPLSLESLNPAQRQAVNYLQGPLLIFAGAGSGKTRVIVHRVANLIASGVNPAEILCLTFTNKAASEMRQRLQAIIGPEAGHIWAGTFHSFGAWFLRHEAQRLDYPRSFVIYDAADQKSLMGKCINDLKLKREKGLDSTLAWLNSLSKDTSCQVEYLKHELPFDPRPVIDLYEKRLREYSAFDFGDLLTKPCRIMQDNPEVAAKYQHMFRYIMVDEYQDTNLAQYDFLMQLVGSDHNLCVVGDDDQSIYGWRGADVGNILRFKDDFPEAEVIVLEHNYRSTESILKAASTLIANNSKRAPKNLRAVNLGGEGVRVDEFRDDGDEAAHVAWRIGKLLDDGASPADIGVFYRVNALSRQVEEAFVRARIPYAVFGGLRFYERREIKDVIAYLRLIVNPRDTEALKRVINTPVRGIGEKSLAALVDYAEFAGIPALAAISEAITAKVLKGKAAVGAAEFLSVMSQLKALAGTVDLAELIEQTARLSGLKEALKAEVDGQDRLTNIRELAVSAEGEHDLERWLEEKALMNPVDDEPGEKVSVMTLHMSKGLEFDYAFILGLEEGILPHSRSLETTEDIEEERRLLYVGITRARKRAYLSWARVRAMYGREIYQIPSGFLNEIGD